MIKVTGHRLLLKMEKLEDADKAYRTAAAAGIIFAETEDHKRARVGLDRGTVIEVGPDCWKAFYLNSNPQDPNLDGFQPWCQKGDFIAFAKYSGKLITDPETDQEYVVINDEDVVATIVTGVK